VNLGQIFCWVAFLGALTSMMGWLVATTGRPGGEKIGRVGYGILWGGLFAATVFLWRILFTHDFRFEYVASYSSRAMPPEFVYAAFWGGQEGTFLLWGLLTCTLGWFVMRMRSPLRAGTMLFMSLPLVMLTLVSVMRGPFLMLTPDKIPADGNGLNPLLQDFWMTIHPPILFIGFSSLVVPWAIGMAALIRRDYDGWIKPVLPWTIFSTTILATGFIMGGVWAYKVLGWGGYWGWDPVENGSFIPWLSNTALLHGLMVQRATGSLRRTNFFLCVTSYALVLYASFLTRSGVLADFSVHSFANLGLSGFLLSFLFLVVITGYGMVLFRVRDIPGPKLPLGNFSRESMMWLGQLVFMLMAALIAVGMSAPLITRLFGPASNVQTSYYNLVNAPLAIALGLLIGAAPLMRWRKQEPKALARAAAPAIVVGIIVAVLAAWQGVRDPMPMAILFAAGFALASNVMVAVRSFRAGWRHAVAYIGHAGVAIMLIGIISSSGYGRSVQVQLPRGQERVALGYRMKFEGMKTGARGQDHAMIAVTADRGNFEASPALYWSEYNQGYMKKPHIERYLSYDLYISPLDMVGLDRDAGVWLAKGESQRIGQVVYTFEDFEVQMGDPIKVAARMTAEIGGRTVPIKPQLERSMTTGAQTVTPAYMPGGGTVEIVAVDPTNGRVQVKLPGGSAAPAGGEILAVEVSTKPLVGLVWLGAIVMLGSALLSMVRRFLDLRKPATADA